MCVSLSLSPCVCVCLPISVRVCVYTQAYFFLLLCDTLTANFMCAVHSEGAVQGNPFHPSQRVACHSAWPACHRHFTARVWQDNILPAAAGHQAAGDQGLPQATQGLWGECRTFCVDCSLARFVPSATTSGNERLKMRSCAGCHGLIAPG